MCAQQLCPSCPTDSQVAGKPGLQLQAEGRQVNMQGTHCMQEQVRVSSTERIVCSSPWSVTVRSSTSTGLLVNRIRLRRRDAEGHRAWHFSVQGWACQDNRQLGGRCSRFSVV
jgi:hypothetical protein